MCGDVAGAAQGVAVRGSGYSGAPAQLAPGPHGGDGLCPQDPTFKPCPMKTHFLFPFPVNYVAECIRTAPYAAPAHARCEGEGHRWGRLMVGAEQLWSTALLLGSRDRVSMCGKCQHTSASPSACFRVYRNQTHSARPSGVGTCVSILNRKM